MQKLFYREYANWVTWAKLQETQLSDPLYHAVNSERTIQLVRHRKKLFHKKDVKDI
jgi:hypothetical protein